MVAKKARCNGLVQGGLSTSADDRSSIRLAGHARPLLSSFEFRDNRGMDSHGDLTAALAAISDGDLCGLSEAIAGSPNVVPGLLAWLEAAVDWEINRRDGAFYPLLGPRAAIDDTETDASLLALAIMAACFRNDGRSESKAVAEFLDLAASTLRAELDRPETLQ